MTRRATREAFGETLIELVKEGLDVMAVDADLAGSTKTAQLGAYDPDRLVDVGIAEQDMIDVAAGLALAGRTVFTGSFAVFGTGRCYDQIRNTVCDSNLDVKICPTHAGITVGEDGATHQMLEDITLMRVLPNMRVLVPADYWAAKAALRLAAKTPGPVYVRLGRHKVPLVYDETFVGGLPFAGVVREGTDVTIAAAGVEPAHKACLHSKIYYLHRILFAHLPDVLSGLMLLKCHLGYRMKIFPVFFGSLYGCLHSFFFDHYSCFP